MPLPAILAGLAPYILPLLGGAAATGIGSLLSSSNNTNQQRNSSQPKGSFLGGTPAFNTQLQKYNPQQQAALSKLLQSGLGGLQNLQKGFDFAPIEAQARRGFANETIPGIAERFTSMGSGGALSSPAFASQLGQAGAGLEQSLAALKSDVGLKQQAQQQNLTQSLLGLGLTPQTENIFSQRQPGFAEQVSPGLLQGLIFYLSGGLSGLGSGAYSGLPGSGPGFAGSSQSSSPGVLGQGQGQGFANPQLQSSGLSNLLRPF